MNTVHLDLVGINEIARRAGVDPALVYMWSGDDDFPEPEARLDVGVVWVWGPVHLWLRVHQQRSDADLPR